MAIAKNLLKNAAAMALQMVLPFGHALVWNSMRPTTRLGRLHRSMRTALMKARGRVAYPKRPVYAPKVKDARVIVQASCLLPGLIIGTDPRGRWMREWFASATPVWP